MDQNYQKLWKIQTEWVSARSLSVVMAPVVEERRAIRSRRHLFFCLILLLSSLVALVPVFKPSTLPITSGLFSIYL